MTKETVVKGLIEIVSNAQMVGSFHDAYNNDKCYYHKGHNCYIVQTIKINEQFGCAALQDSYTNIVCVLR